MPSGPVVPESHGAHAPAETVEVLRLRCMVIEVLKQGAGLSHSHALEMKRKGWVDEQHLALALRVGEHDRVDYDMCGCISVPKPASQFCPHSEHMLASMDSVHMLQLNSELCRQSLIGFVHIRKERVAALLWNLTCDQD